MAKIVFKVTGMSCSACVARVEKSVSALNEVEEVSVNLMTGKAKVVYDDNTLSRDDIKQTVEKSGYGVEWIDDIDEDKHSMDIKIDNEDEARKVRIRLTSSVVLLIILMCVSMLPMMIGGKYGEIVNAHPLTNVVIQFLLLIPITFLNRKYFIKGLPPLYRGGANMDTLVALGAGASIIYGIYVLIAMCIGYDTGNAGVVRHLSHQIYFESAATILTLITVGKYLEERSKGKTGQAIEKLLNLIPDKVTVIRDDEEREIAVKELVSGDVMVIRPGERIPADGIVVKGMSFVNQAAITGESLAIEKMQGDEVVSASINESGTVYVKCTKVGKDSTLGQITELVEEAIMSKAPMAKLADKIAGIFVPVVIGIALVTTVVWFFVTRNVEFSLSMGIAVLVISCPCALGLATPVAIMAGTGRAFEMGILVKSAEAFENTGRADTVVLDKTGTITEGVPKIVDYVFLNHRNDDFAEYDLLNGIYHLENKANHPLAKAFMGFVKEYTKEEPVANSDVEDFIQIPGRGIKANIHGRKLAVGNIHLMKEENMSLCDEGGEYMSSVTSQGKSILLAGFDDKVVMLFAVMDREKSDSKEAIARLKQMGKRVIMITGDSKEAANAIGEAVGIDKVYAEALPQDKSLIVQELKSEGKKVIMVGDGINDSPALAGADVGMAIGAGTDIAVESADIVLTGSSIRDVVNAVIVSKSVISNIKENLFWAFIYNTLGIPLSAGVFYGIGELKLSPMIAAFAMSCSSVCVVLNALRLRWIKGVSIKEDTRVEEVNAEVNVRKINISTNDEDYSKKNSKEGIESEDNMVYKLTIEGMMCAHCEATVKKALGAISGVASVNIDLDEKTATVEAKNPIEESTFKKTVEDAGYEFINIKL